jgi:hypothetical protein
MKYLGDSYDRAKTKAPLIPSEANWEAKKAVAVNTPRLISISGFQNLFEQYGRRSTIQHQLDNHL